MRNFGLLSLVCLGFCLCQVTSFATTRQQLARRIPSVVGRFSSTQPQEDTLQINTNYLAQSNVTLSFPSYLELMNCQMGECVTSDPIICGKDGSKFCVKLYPRGGGHNGKGKKKNKPQESEPQSSGFGMSYKVLPIFGTPNERVGMYLQYMQEDDSSAPSVVDATFALRLIGNQRVGRKFNVEWRAGMRFVPPQQGGNLAQGTANDFGAHLMQTPLLKDFMGIDDDQLDDSTPLTAQVEVTIHNTAKENINQQQQGNDKIGDEEEETTTSLYGALGALVGQDIRSPPNKGSNKEVEHDGKRVRVGKIVVPILRRLSERPRMFEQGAYPGVEYRILRILKDGQERFTSCPGCDYELKPIYPLVAQLERPWPVTVNERDIPKLYTTNMYNAVSAIGALLTAVTGLATAFFVSQAVSFFFIPSRSMDPTLHVGDVLLVDKVSPRLFHNQKAGDVVLFSPPSMLQDIVAANGGTLTSRDLFVKRIAAEPGDKISVNAAGKVQVNDQPVSGRRDLCEAEPLRLIEKYVKPKEQTLDKDEFFVMGDCSSVSIDSRVWGPLRSNEIVGKPILRLWPLERFGPLQTLPLSTTIEDSWSD
jgi:signal peptidase I